LEFNICLIALGKKESLSFFFSRHISLLKLCITTLHHNIFLYIKLGQCHSLGLPRKDGLSESSLRDVLHGSEYVLKYEDKDGDGKHAGDVP